MLQHNPHRTLRCILPANALEEIALGIHHIEVDTVIHQIILLVRFHIPRCRKVNPVLFAGVLGLVPGTGESDEGGVDLGEVGAQYRGSVACGVAGDEDGAEGVRGFGLNDIDGRGHFVKFVRVDVRVVGEAKVDLSKQGDPMSVLTPRRLFPSEPSRRMTISKYISLTNPSP
jgi:hypothetical protein